MTGCAQHATTIILQVRQYAIGLIVIHQNPLGVTIEDKGALHGATNDEAEIVDDRGTHRGVTNDEAETVEDKGALHGATNDEAETVKIGVRTKRVKVIGPVSSVATLTLHSGPNVIGVELRKMAQEETIHLTKSLEETTREEFAD